MDSENLAPYSLSIAANADTYDDNFYGDNIPCRRKTDDRRQRHTHPLDTLRMRGNRRQTRRASDQVANYYVDRYGGQHALLVIAIVFLSCLDAFFTLQIIANGGEEVNPVMLTLMGYGVSWFVAGKLTLTIFCSLFLLIHKNFILRSRLRVTHLLYFFFFGYMVLIQYELVLLALAK